jgi:hypothetical protein
VVILAKDGAKGMVGYRERTMSVGDRDHCLCSEFTSELIVGIPHQNDVTLSLLRYHSLYSKLATQ